MEVPYLRRDNMKPETQKKIFGQLGASLVYAESKHPTFVAALSKRQFFPDFKKELKKELEVVRHANLARENQTRDVAEDLVREELLEGLEEFYNGKYEAAFVEFSHAAVVILRMMEFVEKQAQLRNAIQLRSAGHFSRYDK